MKVSNLIDGAEFEGIEPDLDLDLLFEEMLKRASTPEFESMVKKRIEEENQRFERAEREQRPSFEEMHRKYDI